MQAAATNSEFPPFAKQVLLRKQSERDAVFQYNSPDTGSTDLAIWSHRSTYHLLLTIFELKFCPYRKTHQLTVNNKSMAGKN